MSLTLTQCESYCESMTRMLPDSLPPGYRWPNLYRFLLNTGMAMPVPFVTARHLGPMKECFRNATKTALLPRKKERFVYCEGYALPDGLFPMEHAWLWDTKERCVVETTWSEPGLEYYGIAFTNDYLRTTTQSSKYYGLINNWHRDFPLLRLAPTKLAKVLHPIMETL